MDVHFELDGLHFVWNADKAAENWVKHGVRFEQACEAYLDPLARYLDASVLGEERLGILGETKLGKLLFVVHIEKEVDVTRIISARRATTTETKTYEEYV